MIDSHFFLLFGTMAACGILGGLASYLLDHTITGQNTHGILKYSFLGMIAALTLPFFLHILSSNLLAVTKTDPLDIFVLVGLCLLFAGVSTRLITGISGKRVPYTKKEITEENEKEKPETAQETTKRAEPEKQPLPKEMLPKKGISQNEFLLLKLMSEDQNTDRSLSDLLEEAELQPEELNEILSFLMVRGLVGQKLNESGTLQFAMTTKGRRTFDKISKEPERKEAHDRVLRMHSTNG